MIEETYCLWCKNPLRGRSDKKFCNDQCRSRYNYNQKNLSSINIIRGVNKALKRNRSILRDFNIQGQTRVSKRTMIVQGFNFDYFTSVYDTDGIETYYYCYEMGYQIVNDTEILLVEKDNLSF